MKIGVFISLTLFIVSFFFINRYEESEKSISCGWSANTILIDGDDRTADFSVLGFSLTEISDKRQAILPYRKGISMKNDFGVFATWTYKRVDLFNSEISIMNSSQGIFDGSFEIELLKSSYPRKIRFYSDSIDIYCDEYVITQVVQ